MDTPSSLNWKKRPGLMSDKRKKPPHPETNFLPPLKMVLAFLDHDEEEKDEKHEGFDAKNVEKLIEKLSEKEDE